MPCPWSFLFLFVQLRQLFPQVFHFGHVVDDNVGLVRMLGQVILMITLGIMERFQGRHLSDDWLVENLRPIELLNVRFGNSLLFLIRVEDRRAICVPRSGPWRFNSVGLWATEKKTLSSCP